MMILLRRLVVATMIVVGTTMPFSTLAADRPDTPNSAAPNSVVKYAINVLKTVTDPITGGSSTSTAPSNPVTPITAPVTTPSESVTTTPTTPVVTSPVAPAPTTSSAATVATTAPAVSSSAGTVSNNADSDTTDSEVSYADTANTTAPIGPQIATASAVTSSGKLIFNTIHNFKLSSYSSYGSATMLSGTATTLLLRSAVVVGGLGLLLLLLPLPGRLARRRSVSVPVIDAP